MPPLGHHHPLEDGIHSKGEVVLSLSLNVKWILGVLFNTALVCCDLDKLYYPLGIHAVRMVAWSVFHSHGLLIPPHFADGTKPYIGMPYYVFRHYLETALMAAGDNLTFE